MVGKIKYFDGMQGYGYILAPDGQEIYFHTSSCGEEVDFFQLLIGEMVSFDLIETRIGLEALNLRKIS